MFQDLHIFENPEVILLVASTIFFFSIIAGKAGFRFGLPALLLFLGVGMLFGSDGLGIQFSNPSAAQFIGMLALSIILSSGGRRLADDSYNGGIYLLCVLMVHRLRNPYDSGIDVDGGGNVVYRLSLRLFHP